MIDHTHILCIFYKHLFTPIYIIYVIYILYDLYTHITSF